MTSDKSDRLSADDAHILGLESASITGWVQHLFSSSEPAAHHALRISAISCAGDIGIGLCTDPSALPDIAGLADAIERAYAELRSIATPTG